MCDDSLHRVEVAGEGAPRSPEVLVVAPVTPTAGVPTGMPSGTLAVHACPAALCTHLEFGVASALQIPARLRWSAQPARPGLLRAAAQWPAGPGSAGTARAVAARLRALGPVWFEVAEPASSGSDGERFAYTPDLGMFRSVVSAAGETQLGEGQIVAALDRCGSGPALATRLEQLLGRPWDDALEPLRRAADGCPVSVLRRTG
ncbi:MAG: DUF3145 family protein [Mycobacteriales bacterium]